MSRYKAYPEYRESGVAWLGMVPSHWATCRIKNTATINPAKSEVRGIAPETEVSFIPMEAIGESGELDTTRTKPLPEVISGYSYVADGDIMIAKITPCFENGKGTIAKNLANGIGFATTEVVNVRPNTPEDSDDLFYLLSADPFRKIAEGAMYGAGGHPWRFSFDRATQDMYIGDVGQGSREEIDFESTSSSGGLNYGWRVIEGSLCFNPSS